MPRSHWLDPLARKVLQATGQLPTKPPVAPPLAPAPAWTMDVNRASHDEWRQLPGCPEDTADLLVRLQRGGEGLSQEPAAQMMTSTSIHLALNIAFYLTRRKLQNNPRRQLHLSNLDVAFLNSRLQ